VNSPEDRPTELAVVADNEETEVLSFGPVDQYICQADAFGAAVRSTRPAPTPLDDAIADMTVIDAVFASAASGGWCAVCRIRSAVRQHCGGVGGDRDIVGLGETAHPDRTDGDAVDLDRHTTSPSGVSEITEVRHRELFGAGSVTNGARWLALAGGGIGLVDRVVDRWEWATVGAHERDQFAVCIDDRNSSAEPLSVEFELGCGQHSLGIEVCEVGHRPSVTIGSWTLRHSSALTPPHASGWNNEIEETDFSCLSSV